MKSFVVLSVFVIALSCSPASAGIRRVLRDTDAETMVKDAPAPAAGTGSMSDDIIHKTLNKALKKLQGRATSESFKMDLGKLQSALSGGALDETIDKVKKDLEGQRFDFPSLLASFSKYAPADGEYGELITRITGEAKPLLEAFQKHAKHAAEGGIDGIKALADGAHDAVHAT